MVPYSREPNRDGAPRMIRLSRLADYGVVLMTHVATGSERPQTAAAAAAATRIPEPTASKILKLLARAGLLESQRGINGGFALARAPGGITVAEIVTAVDGPIALTECQEIDGACSFEEFCPTRGNWRKINTAVHHALDEISLADMTMPFASFIARPSGPAPNRASS